MAAVDEKGNRDLFDDVMYPLLEEIPVNPQAWQAAVHRGSF